MNSDHAERQRSAILAADSIKPAKRLRFDRYVLDLDRGCLLLDESEIALRPGDDKFLEPNKAFRWSEAVSSATWPPPQSAIWQILLQSAPTGWNIALSENVRRPQFEKQSCGSGNASSVSGNLLGAAPHTIPLLVESSTGGLG